MMLGPGLRSPAFAMVTTALLFQLVGDALYGFGSLHGWYRVGDPIDLLFVLAAVLWGTAALHPSMVELTEPNSDPEQRLGGTRLAVLSVATLMAPAMLAVAALRAGSSELLVIVGVATTLSALVIVRLAGLVARHERSERREHALGTAAAALVAAWTRQDIYKVAVDSALEVAASEDATVGLTIGAEDDFRVVAAAGPRAARMLQFHPGELSNEAVATLAAARDSGGPRTVRITTALLSQDLTIRYHTPSVERVLGYGEDELVGARLTELLEPDDAEHLRGFFAEVCALKAPRCRETCRSAARTGRSASSRACSTTCSTTRTSPGSSSLPAMSPSDARSRISSHTRLSTTRSPGSPTGRCSLIGSSMRSVVGSAD